MHIDANILSQMAELGICIENGCVVFPHGCRFETMQEATICACVSNITENAIALTFGIPGKKGMRGGHHPVAYVYWCNGVMMVYWAKERGSADKRILQSILSVGEKTCRLSYMYTSGAMRGSATIEECGFHTLGQPNKRGGGQ